MNLLNLKNNQNGFSLIQVLIAFGLTTVLALQLFRMNSMQIKTAQNTEIALDISLMMNQVALYLANTKSCQNTFDGIAFGAPYSFPEGTGIKNRTGNIVYAVGGRYSGERIQILGITITPTEDDPLDPPLDKFGVIDIKLKLKKLKLGDNSLTTDTITRTVPVQIQTNAFGLVEKCYSLSDESSLSLRSQTCELDLGGIWNMEKGKCEGISVGGGSLCGTCQHTEVFEHNISHQDMHGYNGNNKQKKVSQGSGGLLELNCRSILKCQGQDICQTSDDGSWCVPSCPPGYKLQTIYEDSEISEKTFTQSLKSIIHLKTCIRS